MGTPATEYNEEGFATNREGVFGAQFALAAYIGLTACPYGNGVAQGSVNFVGDSVFTTFVTNESTKLDTTTAGGNSLMDIAAKSTVSPGPTATSIPATPITVVAISPTSHPAVGLGKPAKIGIPVVCVAIALVLLLVSFFLFAKILQRKKAAAKDKENIKRGEEVQPYLQPKAELEVEERQKHELEANDIRPELIAEETRHKVATETERPIPSSLQLTHELRGDKHSQELWGSS